MDSFACGFETRDCVPQTVSPRTAHFISWNDAIVSYGLLLSFPDSFNIIIHCCLAPCGGTLRLFRSPPPGLQQSSIITYKIASNSVVVIVVVVVYTFFGYWHIIKKVLLLRIPIGFNLFWNLIKKRIYQISFFLTLFLTQEKQMVTEKANFLQE